MNVESEWVAIAAASKDRRVRRAAAVLAHADLRARLEAEPIGYTDCRQWNGYVPPAHTPRADALRAVVQEAHDRMEQTSDRP